MQLFDRLVEAWPERTIVPSLAERWEISDDGLRYVFHLREGLTWSDGTPLTAHDVEFGIKRVLDPESPGSSVADLLRARARRRRLCARHVKRPTETQSACARSTTGRSSSGSIAPAPYFMSVVNRPDSGPQPRHAIERHGASWIGPENAGRKRRHCEVAERDGRAGTRPSRRHAPARVAATSRASSSSRSDRRRRAAPRSPRGDLDHRPASVYTPRLADLMPDSLARGVSLGAADVVRRTSASTTPHPRLRQRRLPPRARVRDRPLGACRRLPPPTSSPRPEAVVPPALQGHTPDIALALRPRSRPRVPRRRSRLRTETSS